MRVVFDASTRAFIGVSLNNCLFSGPKLQRDFVDVLDEVCFNNRYLKIYRQILITPEHREYQHIFSRSSPHN